MVSWTFALYALDLLLSLMYTFYIHIYSSFLIYFYYLSKNNNQKNQTNSEKRLLKSKTQNTIMSSIEICEVDRNDLMNTKLKYN